MKKLKLSIKQTSSKITIRVLEQPQREIYFGKKKADWMFCPQNGIEFISCSHPELNFISPGCKRISIFVRGSSESLDDKEIIIRFEDILKAFDGDMFKSVLKFKFLKKEIQNAEKEYNKFFAEEKNV